MGTLILLSSSPPQPFARSPTPVASSSPAFASPSSIFGKGHRKSISSVIQRNGFEGGSSTTRSILGKKIGSENLPFGVTKSQHTSANAAKELSRQVKSVAHLEDDGRKHGSGPNNSARTEKTLMGDLGKKQLTTCLVTKRPVDDDGKRIFVVEDGKRSNSLALSPLLLDKAPSRRLDWTPPKESTRNEMHLESEAGSSKTSLPEDLLQSFGYEGGSVQSSITSKNDERGTLTKRRRLDFVDSGTRKPSKTVIDRKLVSELKGSTTATTKLSRSPQRKPTTITGLATSHYFREEQRELEASPMLQYLAATQARDNNSEEPLKSTAKRKGALKKLKVKKKSLPTSVLLSPESALKAIDSQDTLFGSASQLARDESPTFVRDMVEATRQSESSMSCTPVPTQITTTSEPGSSGILGTSRFIKSRNLWATASRDEDYALLQVDTIDLSDSPNLRLAFAGKDAMLEPTVPRPRESASPEKALNVLHGGHSERAEASTIADWLDIDDIGIPTPKAHVLSKPFAQRRTVHTISGPPGGRAKIPLKNDKPIEEAAKSSSSRDVHERTTDTSVSVAAGSSTKPPEVRMPIFGGFTTAELSNQIKKYGFKPIKKREKMIEVLEDCWKAQHHSNDISVNRGAPVDSLDEDFELATHGDILSNVHGLAARPIPKVLKTKVSKLKNDKSTASLSPARRKATSKDDKDVDKIPKQRKKAEPKAKKQKEPLTEKVTRKRAVKATALSAEYVVDISDNEDVTAKELHKMAKPLALGTAASGPDNTVPSVLPLAVKPSAFTPSKPSPRGLLTPRRPKSFTQDLPDINSKITEAITTYVASPSRDHQRDPTWHERILMYDPIVLEDLAAWLNTEGLGLVGEDREVSALEVRAWCEMKGVCCYGIGGGWRGNVKGKTRAGEGEAEN